MERSVVQDYIAGEHLPAPQQDKRMPVRTVQTLMLAMVATVAFASPCHALLSEPLNQADRTRLILDGRAIDLQTLDRIQSRRNFQRQQQWYREQDRRLNRPQRPEVPVMRQDCAQPVILGKTFLENCR
jgi:hypothetical protein